jgi:hypothetical protein
MEDIIELILELPGKAILVIFIILAVIAITIYLFFPHLFKLI